MTDLVSGDGQDSASVGAKSSFTYLSEYFKQKLGKSSLLSLFDKTDSGTSDGTAEEQDNDQTNANSPVTYQIIDVPMFVVNADASQQQPASSLSATKPQAADKKAKEIDYRGNILNRRRGRPSKKNTQQQYQCDFADCHYSTAFKWNLVKHRYIHTGERPFSCDWPGCEKRFSDPSTLIKHRRRHMDSDFRPRIGHKKHTNYVKIEPPKRDEKQITRFTKTPILKSALNNTVEVAVSSRPIRQAAKNSSLKRDKTPPKVDKNEEVTVINIETPNLTTRANRRLRCKISSDGLFYCSWIGCGLKFQSKSKLKKHMLTHMDAPYKCPHPNCLQQFQRKQSLNKHQLVHSPSKPFKCNWPGCGYATAFKWNLPKHQLVHKSAPINKKVEKSSTTDEKIQFSTSGKSKSLERNNFLYASELLKTLINKNKFLESASGASSSSSGSS